MFGDNVSGTKNIKMKIPNHIVPKLSNDTYQCPNMNANCGAMANPSENPTSTSPYDGARQCDGMTSDSVDKATPIQLTNPLSVPTL